MASEMTSRLPSLVVAALCFLPVASASARPFEGGPEIVVDVDTGAVLESRDADRRWPPASLTKLMTLYTVLAAVAEGRINFADPVVMSAEAKRRPPSASPLVPGQTVRLDDALRILVVKSANDMAVAVAEAVSGTEAAFVADMNRRAASLGMSSSTFVNANGLPDPRQAVTARDMAVLAVALSGIPAADSLFAVQRIKVGTHTYESHNGLTGRVRGVDGMKTGYVCSSGFNVVTSATRGGRRTVVAVFGHPSSTSRDARAMQLIEGGFAARKAAGNIREPHVLDKGPPADLSRTICSGGSLKTGKTIANGVDVASYKAAVRRLSGLVVIPVFPSPAAMPPFVPAKGMPAVANAYSN
jgi:D-alanyl-D-alanine carboxypeptidase